ncbi:MAG: 9-O-acetylesterase, partial [Akkermansiaceae bacterium]
MKKTTLTLFALTTALLLSPAPASAAEEKPAAKPAPEIELGAPFCDHAVLQREMHLPVWRWSQPLTTLTLEFAGPMVTTTADAAGKSMLKLGPR